MRVNRGAAEHVLLVVELRADGGSTSTAGAMISGPIPSPGSRTTRGAMTARHGTESLERAR